LEAAIGDPTRRDYLQKTEGDLTRSCSQRHKNLFRLRIRERMAEWVVVGVATDAIELTQRRKELFACRRMWSCWESPEHALSSLATESP
jgi:hypothetical protein